MSPTGARVREVLAELERRGSARVRSDMLNRYGIVAPKSWGVPVGVIQKVARALGKDHELAQALWASGWYEARLLAAFVDDPKAVTRAQMDRWARDFDNWGVCDTVCFALFDRTPHAWGRVAPWSRSKAEFVKRGGFALLACLGVHDKTAADALFLETLPLIERGAGDERHLVGKGVSWALRVLGRRSLRLHTAALALAHRLAESEAAPPRRIGKEAVRELTGPVVMRKMAAAKSRART